LTYEYVRCHTDWIDRMASLSISEQNSALIASIFLILGCNVTALSNTLQHIRVVYAYPVSYLLVKWWLLQQDTAEILTFPCGVCSLLDFTITVFKWQSGLAQSYLADNCVPVSSVASKRHLIPLFVIDALTLRIHGCWFHDEQELLQYYGKRLSRKNVSEMTCFVQSYNRNCRLLGAGDFAVSWLLLRCFPCVDERIWGWLLFCAMQMSLLPPPRRICNRRCLSISVLATLRKNLQTDLHEIFREGWQWANEQMIKFWCDPDHRLDTGFVLRIRHYWKIRKVVNGHKSAAHTDSPDGKGKERKGRVFI